MKVLPYGCFWCIQKPFTVQTYFQENKFLLLKQENLNETHHRAYPKLWQRKYLFMGGYHAISLETEKYFYLYEEIPGQLYHCDTPNQQISAKQNKEIICFFSYAGNSTCGLKIYKNNEIIKHIETYSAYQIKTNNGNYNSDLDTLLEASNACQPTQLQQYVRSILKEAPPSPYKANGPPHQFYTFAK